MKVRIQVGQSSIELEGDSDEVETILEAYWVPTLASVTGQKEHEPEVAGATPVRSKGGKRPSAVASPKERSVDPTKLSNELKSRPDFLLIKQKVLDAPSDWINKCRLVAVLVDGATTSGDVHRVLNILRIKNSLPTLSRTLADHSQDFLTSGANPTKYTITEAAKTAFLTWLAAGKP